MCYSAPAWSPKNGTQCLIYMTRSLKSFTLWSIMFIVIIIILLPGASELQNKNEEQPHSSSAIWRLLDTLHTFRWRFVPPVQRYKEAAPSGSCQKSPPPAAEPSRRWRYYLEVSRSHWRKLCTASVEEKHQVPCCVITSSHDILSAHWWICVSTCNTK